MRGQLLISIFFSAIFYNFFLFLRRFSLPLLCIFSSHSFLLSASLSTQFQKNNKRERKREKEKQIQKIFEKVIFTHIGKKVLIAKSIPILFLSSFSSPPSLSLLLFFLPIQHKIARLIVRRKLNKFDGGENCGKIKLK